MSDLITENSTVELEKDDAAIIVTPDSIRVVTPDRDDDDHVPAHIQFACAVAYLCVHDPKWVELIMDRFNDELNNMEIH